MCCRNYSRIDLSCTNERLYDLDLNFHRHGEMVTGWDLTGVICKLLGYVVLGAPMDKLFFSGGGGGGEAVGRYFDSLGLTSGVSMHLFTLNIFKMGMWSHNSYGLFKTH